MKTRITIAAAIILLAVGGFISWKNVYHGSIETKAYVFYKNENLGFAVHTPKNWTVAERASVVIFSSPDFATTTPLYAEMGNDNKSSVLRGASIAIYFSDKGNLNPSIQDPQKYADFYLKLGKDCSNCADVQEVRIAEQPALTERIVRDDGKSERHARLVHDGREVYITYQYGLDSSFEDQIWQQVLRSFQFTK